jgi:hypothetical protein
LYSNGFSDQWARMSNNALPAQGFRPMTPVQSF